MMIQDFNPRRIHTIVSRPGVTVDFVHIDNGDAISVYESVTRFLNRYGRAKFARRPFAGAERIIFSRPTVYGDFLSESLEYGQNILLCDSKVRMLLKVGEHTKKFSLWVKRI